MPRGKNYVNNNKGMALQAHKKSQTLELCFYGAACNRKDCIYRHDKNSVEYQKSNDPCMAFLAGTCAYTGKTCRKRHPSAAEAEKLRAKYSTIRCRYGEHCKTKGCLYIHPGDANYREKEPNFLQIGAFPPLNQDPVAKLGSTAIPGSAWRAAPVVRPEPATAMQQQQQQMICRPAGPTSAQLEPQSNPPALDVVENQSEGQSRVAMNEHRGPPQPYHQMPYQPPMPQSMNNMMAPSYEATACFPGNPQEEAQLQQQPFAQQQPPSAQVDPMATGYSPNRTYPMMMQPPRFDPQHQLQQHDASCYSSMDNSHMTRSQEDAMDSQATKTVALNINAKEFVPNFS